MATWAVRRCNSMGPRLRALPYGRSMVDLAASIDGCRSASIQFATLHPLGFSSMSAYQGFRLFSHVVIALMLAGIVYAAYIAITYWTGISV